MTTGRAAVAATATMEATAGRAVAAKMAATAAMATTDCDAHPDRLHLFMSAHGGWN